MTRALPTVGRGILVTAALTFSGLAQANCVRGGVSSDPDQIIRDCSADIEEGERRSGMEGGAGELRRTISAGLHGFYSINKNIFGQASNELYRMRTVKANEFAATYNNRGLAYLLKGEIDRALADFDRAISIDRDFAVAFGNRGDAFRARGDRLRALAAYADAIRLAPTWPVPLVDRGWTLVIEGRFSEGNEDFAAALKFERTNAFALYGRAYASRQAGDTESAERDVAAAIALEAGVRERIAALGVPALDLSADAALRRARASHCRDEAIRSELRITGCSVLIETLGPQTRQRAEALHTRATLNGLEYRLDASLADYTEAIRIEPRNPAHYGERASVYERKEDYPRAVADYSTLIGMNKGDIDLYRRRARVRERNDLAGAIADYGKLIALQPKEAGWLMSRGVLRRHQGDLPRAIADFTSALRKDPGNASYLQTRADAWKASGQTGRALADLTEVIRLKPHEADPYLARAEFLAERRRFEEAIADYDYVVRLAPTFIRARQLRGDAHLQSGALDRALADYEEVIRLDGEDADVAPRGLVFLLRGELDKALHDFDRALARWGTNPVALYGRGAVRLRTGRISEGAADRRAAADIDAALIARLGALGLTK